MSYPTPPRSNAKLDIDQAWYRLASFLRSGTSWENVLFVDQANGNDASAMRGSFTSKYATIQAALDAAEFGDTVWVGPGSYVLNAPIVWPSVGLVTLRGFGRTETFIIGEVDVGAVVSLAIRDLGIINIGGSALVMDGSASATSYNSAELSDLSVIGAISIETANRVDIHNVRGSDITFIATGNVFIDSCQFGDITVNYPVAPTMAPTSGRGFVASTSSTFDDVTVVALGQAAFGKDTQVRNVSAAIRDIDAPACGVVWSSGKIAGGITIGFTLINVTDGTEIGRFDYAEIAGAITCADDGLGGTIRPRINFRHASLYDTTNSQHLFGSLVDADLRGALFSQDSIDLDMDDGSVDRTNWYIEEPVAGGGGGGVGPAAVNIAPAYPTWAASNYTVLASDIVSPGDSPVTVSVKGPGSFTRTKTADGGAVRYLLVRPYD